MQNDGNVAVVTWIASVVAAIVAITLPMGYLGIAYEGLETELTTETEYRATLITEYINEHPRTWKDKEHPLEALLTRNPPLRAQQWNRVFDLDNNELMQAGSEPDWPVLKRSSGVYDAGVAVGRLEVEYSIRGLLRNTAVAALFGLLLGAAVFITLRVLPLRALRRAMAALGQEVEQHARARREAEAANRAKSQFLAAASHDLRQPMHALGLYAAVLEQKVSEPEGQELARKINASVEALEGLFNELLDISRLDAGVVQVNRTEMPAAPLLERASAQFSQQAQSTGVALRVRTSSAWISSDPVLLERILINLVANALRYTPRGRVLVGCRRRADTLRIEIWDTGIGIAGGELDRVFDEFYQIGNPERDRSKGLGLGLAIVRRTGMLLGHKVAVKSVPGRGSCFSVEVPRVPHTSVPDVAQPAIAARHGAGKTLLVIDDEVAVRDSMASLLREWGYEVIAAGSLEEAMRGIHGAGRPPDAILADYRLRDGATGLDAIRHLQREFGPALPAAVITGDIAPERLVEFRASGYRYLHKPVSSTKLREFVSALLAGS